MTNYLSNLKMPEGACQKKVRVGRGLGSGLGKTCGRGQKGQKARSTGKMGKLYFQGGQTSLFRRLPKRGFRPLVSKKVTEINVQQLNVFPDGTTINVDFLRANKLIRKNFTHVKILGKGTLTRKLNVLLSTSEEAARKIVAAGGAVSTEHQN